MTPLLRLVSLLAAFALVNANAGCDQGLEPPVTWTLEDITVDHYVFDLTSGTLLVEGQFRFSATASVDTELSLLGASVSSADNMMISPVDTEVVQVGTPGPLRLAAGEAGSLTLSFSAELDVVRYGDCWACGPICAAPASFTPAIAASVYVSATNEQMHHQVQSDAPVVFEGTPIDLGFSQVALRGTNAAAYPLGSTACSEDACWLDNANASGLLLRVDEAGITEPYAGVTVKGQRLAGVTEVGVVVAQPSPAGIQIDALGGGGIEWSRTIEAGEHLVRQVVAGPQDVLVVLAADQGLVIDGVSFLEPASAMVVVARLDAATGELVDRTMLDGEGAVVVAARPAGGALIAVGDAIVVLNGDLTEARRLPQPAPVSALMEAPGGDVLVLDAASSSVQLWRLTPAGAARWEAHLPWTGVVPTVAPDREGGALVATSSQIGVIDPSGALVRIEDVGCYSVLAVHRVADQVTLTGLAPRALSVDGTIHRVDHLMYSDALVYATLPDP